MNTPAKRRSLPPPPPSVLIIEDDQDQAELIRLDLAKSGRRYEVTYAATMGEAIHHIQGARTAFSLISVDRGLPDIITEPDFDDALSRIQKLTPTSIVIVNSGNSNPRLARSVQQHGAHFVHKSEGPGMLVAEMERLRHESAMERQINAQKSIERQRIVIEMAKRDAEHDLKLEQLEKAIAQKIDHVIGLNNEVKGAIAKLEGKIQAVEKVQEEAKTQSSVRIARINSWGTILPVLITSFFGLATMLLVPWVQHYFPSPKAPEKTEATK